MDTIDGDESKRNACSLCLDGVNFLADKKLVRNARSHCKLERAGIVRVRRSPYTQEERLQKNTWSSPEKPTPPPPANSDPSAATLHQASFQWEEALQ